MAIFKARVVLHNVPDHSEPVYKQLHDAMEKLGFVRTVVLSGKKYHLPPATYHWEGTATRANLAASAAKAAASLGYVLWEEGLPATARTCGVMVTEGPSNIEGMKPA